MTTTLGLNSMRDFALFDVRNTLTKYCVLYFEQEVVIATFEKAKCVNMILALPTTT